ncbi:hypothetical protein IWW40_001530 [Coemansia sp. RSA 1250]|nr:hypothetical protein IWW40_001530 [Coemansia sp. RSA 1250]
MFRTSAFRKAGFASARRALATGVVYIDRLPAHISEDALIEAAEIYAQVYDVWKKPRSVKSQLLLARSNELDKSHCLAAVRVTTAPVPSTIEAIARLPKPSASEIKQCQEALLAISQDLRERGIPAMPVTKEPDMFQVVAQKALGRGAHTRLFDQKTTSTPNFTQGMIDGYRKGFVRAKSKADIAELLEQCSESDDELEFLAAYFEHTA